MWSFSICSEVFKGVDIYLYIAKLANFNIIITFTHVLLTNALQAKHEIQNIASNEIEIYSLNGRFYVSA